MNIGFHDNRILIKRLPIDVDQNEEILSFDLDNLYPQRIEEISSRSGTCKKAIDRLSRFSRGQGFEDIGQLKINHKGLTFNQSLKFSADDLALNQTVAFHVMYNLNFKISRITPIFSKYCRLGIPEEGTHHVNNIKYSTNWEEDPNKDRSGRRTIIEYDVFDHRPEIVQAQMIEAGSIKNYKGQIFYKNNTNDLYAKAVFDSVLDDIQAEAEIKLYSLRNLQNGFMSNYIFLYPSVPDSPEEKRKIINEINSQSGANNAGGTTVVFDPSPEIQKNIVQKIDQQNVDKMFPETRKAAKENIIESFGTPKSIMGFNPDAGIFNDQDLFQGYKLYNVETSPDRNFLEECYFDMLEFYEFAEITEQPTIQPLKWDQEGEKTSE